MNNEVNNKVNNEVNNTVSPIDQTSTPVENVTPVEPAPTAVAPVAEATPVETAPVEATPVAPTPVEATPAQAEPVAETPAEPRLVQIKPSIGGGSLSSEGSNTNTQVVAKKQSIVPVIVLIVGLIGLAISGYWLYNELNSRKDTNNASNTQTEKLPFSGAFNSKVTIPTTTDTETDVEQTTEATLTYPDFTGKTIEEAKNWCVEQNIEMKIEYVYADDVPSGSIIRQSGEVGTKVDTNGVFTIYVTN